MEEPEISPGEKGRILSETYSFLALKNEYVAAGMDRQAEACDVDMIKLRQRFECLQGNQQKSRLKQYIKDEALI